MITVNQSYTEVGFPEVYPLASLEFKDRLDAFGHLAQVHLAWGANILSCTPEEIKVQSRVLNKVDTAIYKGPVDEMVELCELVSMYQWASRFDEKVVKSAIEAHTAIAQKPSIAGSTQILSMLAGNLIGMSKLKIVAMLYGGVEEPADIDVGLKMKLDELIAALQLVKEGHGSFRTVLAATAA